MDTWPGGPSGNQFSPWGDRGPLGPGPGPIWNPKFKKWTLWGEKSPCGNTHRQTKLLNFKKWILWGKKAPAGRSPGRQSSKISKSGLSGRKKPLRAVTRQTKLIYTITP